MHLVDYQILGGCFEVTIILPVKILKHEAPAMREHVGPVWGLAPLVATANGFCIRIEKHLCFIKAMTDFRIEGAIHSIAIFDILVIKTEHYHAIHVSNAKGVREWNLYQRLRSVLFKKY